jgi:hypothetical protein
MRQDAQQFFSLSQDPRLDAQKLLLRGLQNMGIDMAEGYLAPQSPQIPAEIIQQFLQAQGIPPQAFVAYLDQLQAQQQDGQAQNGNAPPQEAPVG